MDVLVPRQGGELLDAGLHVVAGDPLARGDGVEVHLLDDRLVGLDDAVGDVDAEVALGLQHRDPELALEDDLVLGRPDLGEVGAGVAGGQDVGDAHALDCPIRGRPVVPRRPPAVVPVEQRGDLRPCGQDGEHLVLGDATRGQRRREVLHVLPAPRLARRDHDVELEVVDVDAVGLADVGRLEVDVPRQVGAVGVEELPHGVPVAGAAELEHRRPLPRVEVAPRVRGRVRRERQGRAAGLEGGEDAVGAVVRDDALGPVGPQGVVEHLAHHQVRARHERVSHAMPLPRRRRAARRRCRGATGRPGS